MVNVSFYTFLFLFRFWTCLRVPNGLLLWIDVVECGVHFWMKYQVNKYILSSWPELCQLLVCNFTSKENVQITEYIYVCGEERLTKNKFLHKTWLFGWLILLKRKLFVYNCGFYLTSVWCDYCYIRSKLKIRYIVFNLIDSWYQLCLVSININFERKWN